MGKPRDLFQKSRDTKGRFQAKMGTIKDRKRMDLTETGDINKVPRIHRITINKKILIIQITMMV